MGVMLGQFVSSGQIGELVARARGAAAPWLLFDDGEFRDAYNARPFVIHHRLAEDPLFELEALAKLCRRLPADYVRYRRRTRRSDR